MYFCIGFELFDDTVGIFGIVFGDPGLNFGRIKNGHICFCRIDGLTDWFRKINKLIKNKLIEEILLKAGESLKQTTGKKSWINTIFRDLKKEPVQSSGSLARKRSGDHSYYDQRRQNHPGFRRPCNIGLR